MIAADTALSDVIAIMRDNLHAAGIDQPMREALYLTRTVTGQDIHQSDTIVSQDQARQLMALTRRRACGEPLSRIRGWRDFWTHRLIVDDTVLDPRPDSETLVQAVLDLAAARTPGMVWDMGCGSGCLVVSILGERPDMFGVGVDISVRALTIANANMRRAGVDDRCVLVASDWYGGLRGRADVIVANPPYIATGQLASLPLEVRQFDPRIALDGGRDGLSAYRILAEGANKHLTKGGALVVEVGKDQAESVISIFTSANLCDIRQWSDLGRTARVVAGKRQAHVRDRHGA